MKDHTMHPANRKILLKAVPLIAALLASAPVYAAPDDDDLSELLERVKRIENENAQLRADLQAIQASESTAQPAPKQPAQTVATAGDASPTIAYDRPAVGLETGTSAKLLDHARNVNQRQIVQLEARLDGEFDSFVTLSGQVIAVADAHWSNRANKFGYLMRHPTGNNQRTKATQEVAVHSANLAFTVTPTDSLLGYVEMLYYPEQSFGAGSITALGRNQIQLRKAYVLWGNLSKMPIYASAGKMDVPFGLQDTVSPFTNSSNWHAFAPLAYGGQVGYLKDGLSLRAMAVVGGSQFRGANTPVDGTATPSKLNNFAVDGSYTMALADDASLMLGGSYLHGSAYCQSYPVVHFNPCSDNVPAWAAYGRLNYGNLEVIGDFAQTTKAWPGTHVPDPTNPLSEYDAHKVTAFTGGARYLFGEEYAGTRISAEYSKFIAGPDGSPWRRQDQSVLGLAQYLGEGASLFGEYVHTRGYSPLNFISGGNLADGSTWSDYDANSNVIVLGAKLGF